MSMADPNVEPQPPRGHVRIVYLGPVAPHWEVVSDFGDRAVIDNFRTRSWRASCCCRARPQSAVTASGWP